MSFLGFALRWTSEWRKGWLNTYVIFWSIISPAFGLPPKLGLFTVFRNLMLKHATIMIYDICFARCRNARMLQAQALFHQIMYITHSLHSRYILGLRFNKEHYSLHASPHVVYWPDMISNPLFCCHCFNQNEVVFLHGWAVLPWGSSHICGCQ